MSILRRLAGALAVCAALSFGQAQEATAASFSCYNNGYCLYDNSCQGDFASGFCHILCYVASNDCGAVPGPCYVPGEEQECGLPGY